MSYEPHVPSLPVPQFTSLEDAQTWAMLAYNSYVDLSERLNALLPDAREAVQTSRKVDSGAGLTGGGDLTADRTLALDVNGLTAETAPAAADTVPIYDDDEGAVNKATLPNLGKGIINDAGSTADDVWSASKINTEIAAATETGQSYTPTNVVTDRGYDANATTVDELADVLGTLISDLTSVGILS